MGRRGFTLIEMLVIIAIIGILASFLALGMGQMKTKARIKGTIGLFQRLSVALQGYREEFRGYVPDADFAKLWEGSGDPNLAEGTFRTPSGRVVGPFLTSRKGLEISGSDLLDPWSNAIRYEQKAATAAVEEYFVLISAGPDGAFDTADDIVHDDNEGG